MTLIIIMIVEGGDSLMHNGARGDPSSIAVSRSSADFIYLK